jgi:hypothetical protein
MYRAGRRKAIYRRGNASIPERDFIIMTEEKIKIFLQKLHRGERICINNCLVIKNIGSFTILSKAPETKLNVISDQDVINIVKNNFVVSDHLLQDVL